MSNYIGALSSGILSAVPGYDIFEERTSDYYDITAQPVDMQSEGLYDHGIPVLAVHEQLGTLFASYEHTHLWDRLWVFPSRIDAGFIISDMSFALALWNSYRSSSLTISTIPATNLDNTTISVGTLPLTMVPDQYIDTGLVSIDFEGEPTLNGYFTFNFNLSPNVLYLDITATRIAILPIWHNWESGLTISYTLLSTFARTITHREQRRQLYERPRREITISGVTDRPQRLKNVIECIANIMFAVAIETEPISLTDTGSVSGLSTLNTEDTAYFWNLDQADMLAVRNVQTDEVIGVSLESHTDSTVTLEIPLNIDWNAEDIILYPLAICISEDMNLEDLTDGIARLDYTGLEFRPYGT